MANISFPVNISKLVSVSPQTGLQAVEESLGTLYIRVYSARTGDNYVEQVALTGGTNGEYKYDGPIGWMQLWKSSYPDATGSNELTNWHGGSGKRIWKGDDTVKAENIEGELETSQVADLDDLLASKVPKESESSVNIGAQLNLQSEPTADWADHETTANGSALVSVARLNNAIATFAGGLSYYATVFVVPQNADNSGLQYNTLKEAVDYLLTLTPSATKICRVMILNNGGSKYVAAPAGCFQDYIHIQGFEQEIMIRPEEQNITVNTKLINLTVMLSAAYGNRILSSMTFKDVYFICYMNLLIQAGRADTCDFALASGKTMTFGKLTGVYADVRRCLSNKEPNFIDDESYNKPRDCKWESTLPLLTDPSAE